MPRYLWYPEDAEKQAQFNESLAENLPKVASKYGIKQEILNRVAANAAWQRYWVDYRANLELESKQLTKYYNAKAVGKNAEGTITAPVITAPTDAPAEIEGDVKAFVYALRKDIVGRTNYSVADGELLGFEPPKPTKKSDSDITAKFTVRTMGNYNLDVKFVKQGLALRLEMRLKGGSWKYLMTLTNDGIIRVEPTTPGEAQQIELRGVMLRKNEPVGNYSETQTALISE